MGVLGVTGSSGQRQKKTTPPPAGAQGAPRLVIKV